MKVKFLRRGFGLTQEKVATLLGISIPTFKKKEDEELDFTKTEMIKITELFKQYDSHLTINTIFFT